MTPREVNRVRAVHPHWTGHLLLSTTDNRVEHETHGSRGGYTLIGGTLVVRWDDFAPECFVSVGGMFIQETLTENLPALHRLFAVQHGNRLFLASRISLLVGDGAHEVSLRLGSSDIPTFEQIFVRREYDSPALPADAGTVVDLGANIGLATVFFALRYPRARLLAVEPEPGNFAVLRANTAALGTRASARHVAAWNETGEVHLKRTNERGETYGAWGVQVSARPHGADAAVPCETVGTLLDRAGFARADILKIDIEGAELELFATGAAAWLPRVGLIVIETHDRFRPGSDAAVRAALLPGFEELPPHGENLVFRNRFV
jgi:FkbM family methyltransferase